MRHSDTRPALAIALTLSLFAAACSSGPAPAPQRTRRRTDDRARRGQADDCARARQHRQLPVPPYGDHRPAAAAAPTTAPAAAAKPTTAPAAAPTPRPPQPVAR